MTLACVVSIVIAHQDIAAQDARIPAQMLESIEDDIAGISAALTASEYPGSLASARTRLKTLANSIDALPIASASDNLERGRITDAMVGGGGPELLTRADVERVLERAGRLLARLPRTRRTDDDPRPPARPEAVSVLPAPRLDNTLLTAAAVLATLVALVMSVYAVRMTRQLATTRAERDAKLEDAKGANDELKAEVHSLRAREAALAERVELLTQAPGPAVTSPAAPSPPEPADSPEGSWLGEFIDDYNAMLESGDWEGFVRTCGGGQRFAVAGGRERVRGRAREITFEPRAEGQLFFVQRKQGYYAVPAYTARIFGNEALFLFGFDSLFGVAAAGEIQRLVTPATVNVNHKIVERGVLEIQERG
ncbi:hypothetical protein HN371_30455 [Candidatus Poribacteria bacterium]|nr:hypothetical protein [Candidatus Poribacteria bacterium]